VCRIFRALSRVRASFFASGPIISGNPLITAS
jgi:hypothetical protein